MYKRNHDRILRKGNMFGLAWIGDGATIKQMPLMNMLVLCGGETPAVMSVCSCTDHMVDGKKKDADFIGKFFKGKVEEWDPSHRYTDFFLFDGAANVQKAREILCANYPRALCFHGREHVMSLFFKDLSKLTPIQVRKYL